MSAGISTSMGMLGHSLGMQRTLKKSCTYVILDEDEGKELLKRSPSLIVEGLDGVYSARSYSYLFSVDGMLFYFESLSRLELDLSLTVDRIFLPK